jgi:hypothetical protein
MSFYLIPSPYEALIEDKEVGMVTEDELSQLQQEQLGRLVDVTETEEEEEDNTLCEACRHFSGWIFALTCKLVQTLAVVWLLWDILAQGQTCTLQQISLDTTNRTVCATSHQSEQQKLLLPSVATQITVLLSCRLASLLLDNWFVAFYHRCATPVVRLLFCYVSFLTSCTTLVFSARLVLDKHMEPLGALFVTLTAVLALVFIVTEAPCRLLMQWWWGASTQQQHYRADKDTPQQHCVKLLTTVVRVLDLLINCLSGLLLLFWSGFPDRTGFLQAVMVVSGYAAFDFLIVLVSDHDAVCGDPPAMQNGILLGVAFVAALPSAASHQLLLLLLLLFAVLVNGLYFIGRHDNAKQRHRYPGVIFLCWMSCAALLTYLTLPNTTASL